MSELQKIADSYRAVTIKGAWYGPTLAELLAEISPELATMQPTPEAHSISERLPAIPWNELVARWNESRDRLEEKLRNFPLEDLAKQVPGRDYSYKTLLHGIVQHAIYHSGQIAMVLSMLRARQQ